jgi:hypothetical protein
MSQSGSLRNGGGGGGGGVIQTIAGDIGSITGANVTIYANNAANNSGSSVKFVNSGTISTLNLSDSNRNTTLGFGAGSATLTGTGSVAVGAFALNVAGNSSLNVAVGYGTLTSLTTGSSNCCLGSQSGTFLLTGNDNVIISGNFGGNQYVAAESNNILISSRGVVGDNNTIRIGNAVMGSAHTSAFLAGVTGVTAVGSPVAISSTGQLSNLGFGTATQVLTSNGPGVSPTWQAAGGGGSTTGFSAYASSTLSNVTGNNVIYDVIFDSTTRNDGSAYNPATGVFTAPSNGLYSFNTILFLQSGSTFSAGSELLVSSLGSVYSQILCLYGAAASAQSNAAIIVAGSWIVQMTAGDTMQVQAFSNSALQDVSISGAARSPNALSAASTFSGFKIGT